MNKTNHNHIYELVDKKLICMRCNQPPEVDMKKNKVNAECEAQSIIDFMKNKVVEINKEIILKEKLFQEIISSKYKRLSASCMTGNHPVCLLEIIGSFNFNTEWCDCECHDKNETADLK